VVYTTVSTVGAYTSFLLIRLVVSINVENGIINSSYFCTSGGVLRSLACISEITLSNLKSSM